MWHTGGSQRHVASLLTSSHNFTKGSNRLGCHQRRWPARDGSVRSSWEGCPSPDRKTRAGPPSQWPHLWTHKAPQAPGAVIQLGHKGSQLGLKSQRLVGGSSPGSTQALQPRLLRAVHPPPTRESSLLYTPYPTHSDPFGVSCSRPKETEPQFTDCSPSVPGGVLALHTHNPSESPITMQVRLQRPHFTEG